MFEFIMASGALGVYTGSDYNIQKQAKNGDFFFDVYRDCCCCYVFTPTYKLYIYVDNAFALIQRGNLPDLHSLLLQELYDKYIEEAHHVEVDTLPVATAEAVASETPRYSKLVNE